ncbi:hypothetical protein D3C84_931310 [compost metagenome]
MASRSKLTRAVVALRWSSTSGCLVTKPASRRGSHLAAKLGGMDSETLLLRRFFSSRLASAIWARAGWMRLQ